MIAPRSGTSPSTGDWAVAGRTTSSASAATRASPARRMPWPNPCLAATSAPPRLVGLLAGGDRQRQAVLVRRQRAGRVRRERTRRVVGAVEVELHAALRIRGRCVQEAAGAIAAVAVGGVGEDQEQLSVAAVKRLQPVLLPLALEHHSAGIRRGVE